MEDRKILVSPCGLYLLSGIGHLVVGIFGFAALGNLCVIFFLFLINI